MATAIHESTITKNIARNSPRALPPDILAKIEEKKLLLKVWQRSRHPADKAAVNKATAQVKRLIAEHTQASWRRACDELGALRASSTAYWKRLDKLSDEKPRLRRIHKLQLADGTTTSDPTAISERFATNLASVFQVFQGDDYNKDFYEETESEASSLFTSFNPGDEQPTDTAEIAALLKDIRTVTHRARTASATWCLSPCRASACSRSSTSSTPPSASATYRLGGRRR